MFTLDSQDIAGVLQYVTQFNASTLTIDDGNMTNGSFIFPVHVALLQDIPSTMQLRAGSMAKVQRLMSPRQGLGDWSWTSLIDSATSFAKDAAKSIINELLSVGLQSQLKAERQETLLSDLSLQITRAIIASYSELRTLRGKADTQVQLN